MITDAETHSKSLVRAQGDLWKKGRKDCRSHGVQDSRKTWPTESTKQGLTETQVAIMEPAWVCARSSYMLCLLASLIFLWES